MNILISGFGGQGILFSGKVIAYAGLNDGQEVSWLPSYGPEMRGGTANCSVCLSKEPIGSPLVVSPDVLVVMNLPSLDKFIDSVVPNGLVIIDSSIVTKKVVRKDVNVVYIEATKIAEDNGLKGMANMVITGRLFKESKFCSAEALDAGILKSVPASKAKLIESNRAAVKLGIES
jgi:Pyruvate:ferredoxin oxidoreductase and related 2-oxoacid:ferredoxin oxidoreductases, gamma subunit